ncbi:class I SAM-dependent methyltransferase [Fundidesulfovibrio putealis]|uniref:class I SAM-dependent methyltransferase n=1 Tax=Fundidesulfovibrio putealis TaxID=270496 RepID=UPI00042702C7|nr:class I SAM-dependent methyltransferase [Fundidesulfovibrio putealis]
MAQNTDVQAGFEKWRVFEKARKANRMHHAEAYDTLLHTLAETFNQPPRILDLGCGDARDVARVLRFVPVRSYSGVDNDADVLERARGSLSGVGVPVDLKLGGYEEALSQQPGSYDVIWLGLFLHHLPRARKEAFFTRARTLLRPGGAVIAHDPVLEDGESRQEYIARISKSCRSGWPELTNDEKDMMTRHWGQHGHQESAATLGAIALNAGFSSFEELWADADRFYAVLVFWN